MLRCVTVFVLQDTDENLLLWERRSYCTSIFSSLNQFKSHVWHKQVFAGRNQTMADGCHF